MPDGRRKGDTRPLEHDAEVSLTLTPAEDRPFRWLPKHGDPYCIGEWASQHIVRSTPYLVAFTTLLCLAIFVFQLISLFK